MIKEEDEEMEQDSWQDEQIEEAYGVDERKKKKVNFVYFKLWNEYYLYYMYGVGFYSQKQVSDLLCVYLLIVHNIVRHYAISSFHGDKKELSHSANQNTICSSC